MKSYIYLTLIDCWRTDSNKTRHIFCCKDQWQDSNRTLHKGSHFTRFGVFVLHSSPSQVDVTLSPDIGKTNSVSQQHWAQRHALSTSVAMIPNQTLNNVLNQCMRHTCLIMERIHTCEYVPPKKVLMFFFKRPMCLTWESKQQQQQKTERRQGDFFFMFLFLDRTWASGDVIWNPCWLNCTPWSYPPTLIHLPPSFLSLIVVVRIHPSIKKLAALLQLILDKPSRPGLTWTRLLFIHLHQHPSPPLWPSFSWQALISIPNHWQTWGFEMPHSAPYGM